MHGHDRYRLAYIGHITAWFRGHLNYCVLGVHYSDVIMGAMASHITSLAIVFSTVYSDADQRKHHCPASLALVRGIHRFPHKWPVTWKMFPFDDVIMIYDTSSFNEILLIASKYFVMLHNVQKSGEHSPNQLVVTILEALIETINEKNMKD